MILDCHTHIFPEEIRESRESFFAGEPDFELLYAHPGSKLAGSEELVGYLDAGGLDGACAFGFPWNDTGKSRLCNDYALAGAKAHPGRVLPFCCVNPLSGSEAVKEAERCIGLGAVGVGEIATYGAGLGDEVRRRLVPLAKLCREADVPLLLHTNEPVGHAYPGKSRMEPGDIYALVKDTPGTKWILAHWGGGLFAYMLQKKEVDEVLANVYYDTAAGPYLYKPAVYNRFIEIAGPGKLLFGSDQPLLGIERYVRDMEEANLSGQHKAMILGDNLAALLGVNR